MPHTRVPIMLSLATSAMLCALTLCFTAMPTTARAADLSGTWQGSWESCRTGHHGPLNATFTRCSDAGYRVTFTGKFLRFIPFRYTVTLDVVADDGMSVTLAGSSNLGRLFGTFTYRATADHQRFDAAYSSKKDDGAFRLRKVGH